MAGVKVATGRSAQEILAWSRTTVDPAMRQAVASLPAPMQHIAGYHLGWWDGDGRPVEGAGGKAVRPALALLSAETVGGVAEDAVPVAVAVEMVHNFSLLHDDVIDRDETRRHRPTAWRAFGVSHAILAGDALLALALDVVSAAEPWRPELARAVCAAVQALIDGQCADVAFESRVDVDLGECLTMAAHKTGALLSCACRLGALAGGGTSAQVEHLSVFGERLGLAFQVADDLQGIWGDPQVTGKPTFSDLRNRKKSLPVVAALVSGTAAGAELAAWFGDAAASTRELSRIAALVENAGGRQWCHTRLDSLREEAMGHLRSASGPARPSAELAALTQMVTGIQRRPDQQWGIAGPATPL